MTHKARGRREHDRTARGQDALRANLRDVSARGRNGRRTGNRHDRWIQRHNIPPCTHRIPTCKTMGRRESSQSEEDEVLSGASRYLWKIPYILRSSFHLGNLEFF